MTTPTMTLAEAREALKVVEADFRPEVQWVTLDVRAVLRLHSALAWALAELETLELELRRRDEEWELELQRRSESYVYQGWLLAQSEKGSP